MEQKGMAQQFPQRIRVHLPHPSHRRLGMDVFGKRGPGMEICRLIPVQDTRCCGWLASMFSEHIPEPSLPVNHRSFFVYTKLRPVIHS
jgi:hypothetical protein